MNRLAFLEMLGVSEGTSTSEITQDRGYDVIVTGVAGPERFDDYREHPFASGRPPKQINSKGLFSTASGKYQFMLHDWLHYKTLLHLPDFGPAAQDTWALQLIRERSALSLIDAGDFDAAVARCANIWASLPGAGYGQHENRIAALRAAYTAAGGTLAS